MCRSITHLLHIYASVYYWSDLFWYPRRNYNQVSLKCKLLCHIEAYLLDYSQRLVPHSGTHHLTPLLLCTPCTSDLEVPKKTVGAHLHVCDPLIKKPLQWLLAMATSQWILSGQWPAVDHMLTTTGMKQRVGGSQVSNNLMARVHNYVVQTLHTKCIAKLITMLIGWPSGD